MTNVKIVRLILYRKVGLAMENSEYREFVVGLAIDICPSCP
jgi:hypothetical protein